MKLYHVYIKEPGEFFPLIVDSEEKAIELIKKKYPHCKFAYYEIKDVISQQDEPKKPVLLPVGSDVYVKGKIHGVDSNDSELPYFVRITPDTIVWLGYDKIKPIGNHDETTNNKPVTGKQ